jgi:hypothetical protein
MFHFIAAGKACEYSSIATAIRLATRLDACTVMTLRRVTCWQGLRAGNLSHQVADA